MGGYHASATMGTAPFATVPQSPAVVTRFACICGYVGMSVIIIGCCFLYLRGTFLRFLDIFYLTGYGIMSIGYYLTTTAFAYLNRSSVDKHAKKCMMAHPESFYAPSVSVHVVGYREHPEYFRKCLESVRNLAYPNIKSVIVVVDGNDMDDIYMADLAREAFGSRATSVDLDFLPSESNQTIGGEHLVTQETGMPPVFVVTQPQAGKREAIYTAYKISESLEATFFVNTDSDTMLDTRAVDELVYMTMGDDDVDAVAGRLEIFNRTNWLAHLTAARYFLAFNIERASQGYHGVVGCISGPLGLYRVAAVRLIVDEWVHQAFMGKKCTFGDDRHMTNKLLSTGAKIRYTHRSFAETETPTAYARFVAQQTRWSKSYWRELFIQSGWATRHWYLMMETVYGVLFPALITVTILTVIFTRTWLSHGAILVVSFVMPMIRCLVVFVLFDRNQVVFLGVLYPLMYFSTLLPVKFVALFTMGQNNWGTSSRKKIVSDYGPVIPVVVWIAILLCGLVWHGIRGEK